MSRKVDIALQIEGWGEAKMEALMDEARRIIDTYKITLDELRELRQWDSLGTKDDIELLDEIEEELSWET
jgi:NAD-dependent DNA ligase